MYRYLKLCLRESSACMLPISLVFVSFRAVVLPAVFFPLIFLPSAWAQSNQGSIAGNVMDESGALIANAKILAKETASGTTYETVSSSAGSYRVANMNTGIYNVTVSAAGFKTDQLTGVVVQVATTSSLEVRLQAGAVTEIVDVKADAPTVQASSSEIGTVVTTKEVLDLPLALGSVVQAMRSPEAFVFLTPGAVGPGTASGNGGTFESKISGGQNYATEVLLDGASTYRSENGSSFDETAPSVEALGEFKVISSTLAPEMGRTTGGIESFSTKPGTNVYHGGAYDIFRNEDLNANTWFNNSQLARSTDPVVRSKFQRPLDKQNDYGFTFGGPVRVPKLYNGVDKTFFFVSWEQYRQHVGGVSNTTVPTVAEHSGDFSGAMDTSRSLGTNPCDGTPIYAGEIFDPATTRTVNGVQCRSAFPGNVIPQNRWSTVGRAVLSYYPNPQNANTINNNSFPFSYPILDTATTVRIDQNLNSKSKAYFTYSSRDNHRTSTTPIFDNVAGAGRTQTFFTHYIRAGYDYALTPTILNHFSAGYNRTNSANIGAGVEAGVNWAQKLGISGTPATLGGTPFPFFGVLEGPTAGLGDAVNGDTIDNGFRFNDTFEWIKGKHDIKAGIDYRYQQYSPLTTSATTGNWYFWRQQTAGTSDPIISGLSGNAIASLLLGQPHDANLSQYANQPKFLSRYYALFLQDSYKITHNLTVNYGLRWDVDVPRNEVGGNTSNISLTAPNPGANGIPGALVFAGTGSGRSGKIDETWAKTWHKDFGPRLGFAWAPDLLHEKTVVRGGFGILYGALTYADFGGFNRAGFVANPAFFTSDGFSPAFNLDSGFPKFAPPPSLDPAQLNNQGPQYVDPSYGRPAMVNNWSLEVQHELATDLILDVAYVGQHSTHLRSNFDAVNSLDPKYLALGSLLSKQISSLQAKAAGIQAPYPGFTPDKQVAQALVPFPQYLGFNTDGALENLGQSSYHALEVSLRRRFRDGLNLLASYTWSKTLTDADSSLPFFATLHGGGSAQNPFNKAAEKAISNQDVPHTLVLSYVYELPFGKGKKLLSAGRIKDKVVGGWEIGGIQRYQSGQPLSFCCATGIPGFAGTIRFNRVPGQSLQSTQALSGTFNPLVDPLFNKNAFVDPNNGIAGGGGYQFGNMPRTTGEVRMFKYLSEDFNLQKRTSISDRANILFEVNFLDAFNRHVFNRPPDLNANDAAFGVLDTNSVVLGPRKIQLQLKLQF